jgi:hypothetical protein
MAEFRSSSIIRPMKTQRPSRPWPLMGIIFLSISFLLPILAARAQASQLSSPPAGEAVPTGQSEESDQREQSGLPAPEEEPDPAPERPEACTDGRELGPIWIQIGAVEAIMTVGQVMPLPVRIKGVCNLGGFKFWITHNRSVATLVDVLPATFLAGEPPVETRFIGLRPGTRYQTIEARRPPGTGGVDGVGTLARLFFKGVAEGYSDIKLVRLFLYDADGNEMENTTHQVRLLVILPRPVPRDPRLDRPSRPASR